MRQNCAACHGVNAVGQNGVAPPLVHKIYKPSHHGDESFQRAAAQGVRAHHWRLGDMPAVEGITREEVTFITT
ncbi:cytochrome c [Planktotalea arctica]|uniref:c-type cytochrome n=1 Tax=Planktotalea arctica TaxID=1481893 RepID=UPI003183CB8F